MNDEYRTVPVLLVVRHTAKAVLFELENGEEVWVPRSVIEDHEMLEVGERNIDVEIAEWWCREKGIAEED